MSRHCRCSNNRALVFKSTWETIAYLFMLCGVNSNLLIRPIFVIYHIEQLSTLRPTTESFWPDSIPHRAISLTSEDWLFKQIYKQTSAYVCKTCQPEAPFRMSTEWVVLGSHHIRLIPLRQAIFIFQLHRS